MATHIDNRAIGRLLKSAEVAIAVHELAEAVAENARSQGQMVGDFQGGGEIALPVTLKSFTTDRAVTVVALAHPAGIAVELKHGTLRKAAASQGLEIKAKK